MAEARIDFSEYEINRCKHDWKSVNMGVYINYMYPLTIIWDPFLQLHIDGAVWLISAAGFVHETHWISKLDFEKRNVQGCRKENFIIYPGVLGTDHLTFKEEDLKRPSVAMYQYLCDHIVGTEKIVKTKRMFIASNDNMVYCPRWQYITSGSFGEGLELKGSDYDIMMVHKNICVYDQIKDTQFNKTKSYFQMISEDTKLGFVKLLLLHKENWAPMYGMCVKYENKYFLSNVLVKSALSRAINCKYYLGSEVVHGPCISDIEEKTDTAFCLHSKSWVTQAMQWIHRPNRSWPSSEVKTKIVEHGVLFVPVGVKGSPNEEIEWRMSFSVGEKLLIYTFNHTQLLCYALMKIVLKDVIDQNINCKGLLCSYYIKNILFWVSEETPLSGWTPDNLLQRFMQCLNRLIYCVQYSMCPHYFIPEINMFENKIEGENRNSLLCYLNYLLDMKHQCVFLSPQLKHVQFKPTPRDESKLFGDYINHMVQSKAVINSTRDGTQMRESSRRNKHYLRIYSRHYGVKGVLTPVDAHVNKHAYRQHKTAQCYLAQGLFSGATFGWSEFAVFFYKAKEYKKALIMLSYVLSKCTEEKIYEETELSSIQRELFQSEPVKSLGLLGILRIFRIDHICLTSRSELIPEELKVVVKDTPHNISQVIYVRFLSFLCHYHLGDVIRCNDSLQDLLVTMSKDDFISIDRRKGISLHCLGIAYQLLGDINVARQCFQYAAEYDGRLPH